MAFNFNQREKLSKERVTVLRFDIILLLSRSYFPVGKCLQKKISGMNFPIGKLSLENRRILLKSRLYCMYKG